MAQVTRRDRKAIEETKGGEVEVSEQAELNVLPIIFQVLTTFPPLLNVTGGDGDDGAGRTATATLWLRV